MHHVRRPDGLVQRRGAAGRRRRGRRRLQVPGERRKGRAVLGLLRPAALDQLEVTLRWQRRALLLDDGLGDCGLTFPPVTFI